MIDGWGILFHVLISASLIGISIGLILLPKNSFDIEKKILDTFILVFAFSIISGITLYTEFAFTNTQGLLYKLIHHQLGRSSFIGYLTINIFLFILYYFKNLNFYLKKIVYIIIFFSSLLLSIWSLIVNTIMQNPEIISNFSEHLHLLSIGTISFLLIEKYVFIRLIHNYIAFAIPGLVLVLFSIKHLNICSSGVRNSLFLVSFFILILNISLLFSGHLQIKNIGDLNTHKYTSIVGSEKDVKIYFPGFNMSNINDIEGVDVSRFYPKSILKEIEKKRLQFDTDNKFSVYIFNFFHLMTLLWGLINFLILYIIYLVYRKHYISNFLLILLYILPLLAILSGWMVSELGRQPWLFYKMVLVSEISTHTNSFKLVNNIIIQVLLLFLLHWIIFKEGMSKT
jgi:cytochrome d ubiquinol oxidase subunit I